MRSRIRLNKKGLTARELVLFILAIGVLVLMFWGPLGTWWHNLTQKYNFFERSVDDKINDLKLLGIVSADKKDLTDLAGTTRGIKEISGELKEEIKDKCADNVDFKISVERVTETFNNEIQQTNIKIEKSPAEQSELSGTYEKGLIIEDTRKFICDRLIECFTKDSVSDIYKYEQYSLFAEICVNDLRITQFREYINEIKEDIQILEGDDKFEEAGNKCGRFTRYGMLDYDYFKTCASQYNLLIPSKNGLFRFREKPTDPFCVKKDFLKFASKEKVFLEINLYKDKNTETKSVLCKNGCDIELEYKEQKSFSNFVVDSLNLPNGEYNYIIKSGKDDIKKGKLNIQNC